MEQIVVSDGAKIACYVDDFTDPWTAAPTLLMLHSTMGSSARYYSMVPQLARHYRIVRMDLRGHGASPVPPDSTPFTLDRLTRDAVEVLDHLKTDRAHVLGNSAGGFVAQRLAIDFPDRVLSMILFSSMPGLKMKQKQTSGWITEAEKMGLRAFLAKSINDRFPVGEVDPRAIGWFLDGAAKNDLAFLKKWILHMNTIEFMDEIHKITCPALIVAPGAEPIGPASTYAEMKKRMPTAELIYYENARHNVCDYLADRCADDTLAFLQRHFGGQSTG